MSNFDWSSWELQQRSPAFSNLADYFPYRGMSSFPDLPLLPRSSSCTVPRPNFLSYPSVHFGQPPASYHQLMAMPKPIATPTVPPNTAEGQSVAELDIMRPDVAHVDKRPRLDSLPHVPASVAEAANSVNNASHSLATEKADDTDPGKKILGSYIVILCIF